MTPARDPREGSGRVRLKVRPTWAVGEHRWTYVSDIADYIADDDWECERLYDPSGALRYAAERLRERVQRLREGGFYEYAANVELDVDYLTGLATDGLAGPTGEGETT